MSFPFRDTLVTLSSKYLVFGNTNLRAFCLPITMPQSRKTGLKSAQFDKNINKRGKVPESLTRPKSAFAVGPWTLGLFVFLVIGSAVLQIIASTQKSWF